jgi:FkbM family methyltransferase
MLISKIKNRLKGIFAEPSELKTEDKLMAKYIDVVKAIEYSEKGYFIITLKEGIKMECRNTPHSDLLVFEQVFHHKEYLPVCSLNLNNILFQKDPITIVDAGANVGYTALFFKSRIPNALIFSIEPDDNNFIQLNRNIALNGLSNSIFPLKKALMGRSGIQLSTKNDFRDGKDWAVTVEENTEKGEIVSISIPDILLNNNIEELDILKIDIEGAERFLFTEDCDLNYLSKVKSIIIEIHDEFDCRNQIYGALSKAGFILIELGESTLALNLLFLNSTLDKSH